MICPECLSRDIVKFGFYNHKQKWHCLKCGLTTIYPRSRMPKQIGGRHFIKLHEPPKPQEDSKPSSEVNNGT